MTSFPIFDSMPHECELFSLKYFIVWFTDQITSYSYEKGKH